MLFAAKRLPSCPNPYASLCQSGGSRPLAEVSPSRRPRPRPMLNSGLPFTQALTEGVLRLSQSLGQTLGKIRTISTPAMAATRMVATAAATVEMVLLAWNTVSHLPPGPLQTPGLKHLSGAGLFPGPACSFAAGGTKVICFIFRTASLCPRW